MSVGVQHLHTYFLFPFSVDKEAVVGDHQDVWAGAEHWIDGVDAWIGAHGTNNFPIVAALGGWQRSPYTALDIDSKAYQDMVFFHPIVRRVFFDTGGKCTEDHQALLHCYSIPVAGKNVEWRGEDTRGRYGAPTITDLRLFLFANGIGILTIGVEAHDIPVDQALWINEMLRKVYPSSGRQLREGRTPSKLSITVDGKVISEERFDHCTMRAYLPPLSKTITDLLYFTDYHEAEEFEPVLDERMIVYTYASLDPKTAEGYIGSDDYEVLLSRFMYVDRYGEDFRYDRDFIGREMARQVYRRWAHEGTLYAFTSFSNVTLTMGRFDCGEHALQEGFLIHRMFDRRYYLTVVVALFYRATLLDFAERTALVSRLLYRKYASGHIIETDIRMADRLMADFQHFSNYWYFSELANKDEEIEHFQMQCAEYRLDRMKNETEQEIEKLNQSLDKFYQLRNTEAVNRLAMLSMILGGGAMITGYFGMNFGQKFEKIFFNPDSPGWAHTIAVAGVSLITFSAIFFAIFLVITNWSSYKTILLPSALSQRERQTSLRRGPADRVE